MPSGTKTMINCSLKAKTMLRLSIALLLFSKLSFAQNLLVSGPFAGNVQMRTASIWAEVQPTVKQVAVKYWPMQNLAMAKTVVSKMPLGNEFNPVKFELNNLQINTTYQYQLVINGKPINSGYATKFTTQDLWQWRKPAPDCSFLAGSCAYVNEPVFDRPGKPYGGDSSIFETMAKTAADFHIWMGDNWYTREVDFGSEWGLNYRASRDRALPVYQKFLASMPQYFTWDDHDFGPNDAGAAYILKNESRNIFKNYTLNPTYGEDGKGVYTKISFSDIDIFLTDDRFFRSEIEMHDSINGKPNSEKHFFGNEQLTWLQNALLFSKASFKIVVVGNQVLNPLNKLESLKSFSSDYQKLVGFISEYKIPGIVFFSGDRHYSEVIEIKQENMYPLFDVTISPYTSGIAKPRGEEANNPYRVAGTLVEEQNFGKISVTGEKDKRKLQVDFINKSGAIKGSWSVTQNQLKYTKP
jgi:alkaline phosphatase D